MSLCKPPYGHHQVWDGDWCGEWQIKPDAAPASLGKRPGPSFGRRNGTVAEAAPKRKLETTR